ncbi:MAG TPA: hypothetical protein VKR83_12850 [Ktedonobacteraceae bacterium]|nr:hypothetical protein [Ktedonobacteraceae bacterium]
MKKLNRRKFLQVAGASSAVAAGVMVPSTGLLERYAAKDGAMTFRAVAGMPAKPLPNYASYVIEGHVNLATSSGVITKTVFAGSPETMSTIALPGMSRIGRISSVQDQGGSLLITGVVDDRSQLKRGESSTFTVLVDRLNGVAQAEFFGKLVSLNLV